MKYFKKLCLLFIFFLILSQIALAETEIKEFVNDYADMLNETEEQELTLILKEIYDSKTAEYAIVTISSLEGQSLESYSLNLAQGKLGDKEKNNGLLLLISLEDRKYRFEVGRGIEYILNDAKIGRIGRYYLVQNFKEENYGKGIIEASLAVKSILLNEKESNYYIEAETSDNFKTLFLLVLIFIFFIMPVLLGVIFKKYKNKNKYFDAAAGAIIIFGGRGGSGSGSGSGGFGGFGGGGFGGGGAGSGW